MGRGFVRQHRARRYFPGSFYAPYFYSDYDYGYDSEPQIADPPPPQIIEQVAQPAPVPVAPVPDSVVIELQGDHWVRVTNYGQSQTDGPSGQPEPGRAPSPQTAVPRRTQAPEPPTEVPAAVLVFRDGRREEIGKYVVVGSTLYASADYWSSGSWMRKVQLRELDVPATLKLNQERNAKFSLPSGPNEVIPPEPVEIALARLSRPRAVPTHLLRRLSLFTLSNWVQYIGRPRLHPAFSRFNAQYVS
jgi:hypothetical protein